jgi:hypothetical protein
MNALIKEKCTLDFAYEVLRELPGNQQELVYVPNKVLGINRDGVMIRFFPQRGDSWIGVFAFGDMLPNGECAIYEGPSAHCLTIVSKGEGYIVSPETPNSFKHVSACPILGVVPIRSHNLILFYDYTEITAYNEDGLLWRTKRISWDGIEIDLISDKEIVGKSWDAPNNKYVEFRVNLTSGSHQGGASPPE